MNVEDRFLMIERAKAKNDGVYTFKGNVYAVRDKKVVAFYDNYYGKIYQPQGAFNICLSDRTMRQFEAIKELKDLLKRIK